MELSPEIANYIVESIGGAGQPPETGFEFFSAGLDEYLSTLDEEYLGSYLQQGGSSFKMVVGVYGGGKTHFLYSVRDIAWRKNFIASYVALSGQESPFHKLELVYKAITRGLVPPLDPEELLSGYERGLPALIRRWVARDLNDLSFDAQTEDSHKAELLSQVEMIKGIESLSFEKAIKAAYKSVLLGEDEDFNNLCQWLTGEGYDRRVHAPFGIMQKLDRTTVSTMFRSLAQWLRQIGFSGLVVLFDEAERMTSMTGKQRETHLSNLRELIDDCTRKSLQGVFLLYAVPDQHFLEGGAAVYEALRQRVSTVFEEFNPTGVRIELEPLISEPISFLQEVGEKVVRVYEVAKGEELDPTLATELVSMVAEAAYGLRFGDIGYKRLFVQGMIKALNFLRKRGQLPSMSDLGWD